MELTKEEKANILNQHIKSSMINSFNLELSIMEQNAANVPNTEIISDLQQQLDSELSKQRILNGQLETLFN